MKYDQVYTHFIKQLKDANPELMDNEFYYLIDIAGYNEYFDDFQWFDIDLNCLKLFEVEELNNAILELPEGFISHQGFASVVCLSEPRFGFN